MMPSRWFPKNVKLMHEHVLSPPASLALAQVYQYDMICCFPAKHSNQFRCQLVQCPWLPLLSCVSGVHQKMSSVKASIKPVFSVPTTEKLDSPWEHEWAAVQTCLPTWRCCCRGRMMMGVSHRSQMFMMHHQFLCMPFLVTRFSYEAWRVRIATLITCGYAGHTCTIAWPPQISYQRPTTDVI